MGFVLLWVMSEGKRILVAPLNWGLGHATRCIPIINALIKYGYQPIIASDGVALRLLQKEFPQLPAYELPSYKIKYAEKGKNFKMKMIWDSPKVLKAMTKEKKVVKQLVKELDLDGIISDNRLGVYAKKVPCVFITHQLNVLSGNTTWFSSKIHQRIIKKFKECWVPDVAGKPNLTGKLGHLKKQRKNIKYLGPLSRFSKTADGTKYNLMVLLSGPEPQRTFLQEKLLAALAVYRGRVLFVKGKIEKQQRREVIKTAEGHLEIVNFMQSAELEKSLNCSDLIISRSGYTTVMDLAKLEKKAFFIPTLGQYEQEYLAKRLQKQGMVPFCEQDKFNISQLERTKEFKGLTQLGSTIDYELLFQAFSKVKENSEPTSISLST